jgi:ribosomal protein S27AE
LSGQDGRIDEALSAKLSSRACPVCGRGEFEPLRGQSVAGPRSAAGVEPIETVAQVCVRCGFVATHAVKYLLEKESQ